MDELGPLEVKPQLGENWGLKPDRVPATYNRKQGVRHLLAALDLRSNKIYAHIKKRKRWCELLQFLKYIRSLSKEKIYIIQGNFSPHLKEEVTTWCESNDIEAALTPTNASWLNKIEGHFTGIKKFAIKNSNYKDHKELAGAIGRYLIWRNKNANDKKLIDIENKVNFS